MLHGTQISITSLLATMLVVALVIQFGTFWPASILLAIPIVIIAVSEILLRSLPAKVVGLYHSNCHRADGTLSTNRQKIENEQFRQFRSNVRLIVFISIVPSLALIWFDSFSIELLMAAILIWLLFSFTTVRSGYLYYLNQHIFYMKMRAQNYRLRDLDIHVRNIESVQ